MANGKGNAVIGQSGGPTSVINQSLVGVIEQARSAGHIGQLLGARHGVSGIVKDDFVPLDDIPIEKLVHIANTPSAALGSTRDKPDEEYCHKIFEVLKKRGVQYFFYIGGNDSADTARICNDLAKREGYDLRVFHIPKTIDNDLRVHDHTPGYGSAAKFVACAMMGDNYDNASLPGIKVDIIMGRHAGFLTAAAALARQHPEDGPHLIYVPESPVSQEQFLKDVEAMYRKHGRCLIAASEGITDTDGKTYAEKMSDDLQRDAHGNLQLSGSGALGDHLASLITKNLQSPGGKKLRVRADTFGYLQRSFAGFHSEVDAAEAKLVGEMAVEYSRNPELVEGSVAMERASGPNYRIKTILTPLSTVARVTKHMDPSYLKGGNDVTEAFLEYCKPLVGKLPVVGTLGQPM